MTEKKAPAKKKSEIQKTQERVERSIEKVNNQVNEMVVRVTRKSRELQCEFADHKQFLSEIMRKMESIDEMMSCILVAVRQNEYLQTYYPAQHGFPEMKCGGIHPAKLMNKAANND